MHFENAIYRVLQERNNITKIHEKSHTSLHYCLLFAIHIYFSDFFLGFSRELNSIDNKINLNFTNGTFL